MITQMPKEGLENTKLRVATINVRTLQGKNRPKAAMLECRRVNIACLQETRWNGNKILKEVIVKEMEVCMEMSRSGGLKQCWLP